MAFNTTKNTSNIAIDQTVNVGVDVTPVFNFGSGFLSPISQALAGINDNLQAQYQPLTQSLVGSVENANRLATDIRRTHDFSLSPSAQPGDPSPSPLLIIMGGLALSVVLYKLL